MHYDIANIIHRDFSCMNVTLYSIIYMLGVLVMRGVVRRRCCVLHSAVSALHLMSHKHNPNKLVNPRLITSESNEHNQPTSTKHPTPDYFGRLYPVLQTLLLISGTVFLYRDLHLLYLYKIITVSPSGTTYAFYYSIVISFMLTVLAGPSVSSGHHV